MSMKAFPFTIICCISLFFQIIAEELYRNLALALASISVTTFILLSNWLGGLLVVAETNACQTGPLTLGTPVLESLLSGVL